MMMRKLSGSVVKNCRSCSSGSRAYSSIPSPSGGDSVFPFAAVSAFGGYMAYIMTDYVKSTQYHKRLMESYEEGDYVNGLFDQTLDMCKRKKKEVNFLEKKAELENKDVELKTRMHDLEELEDAKVTTWFSWLYGEICKELEKLA